MKPFVKWAGGKTRLLKEIELRLPAEFYSWNDVTYVEPFAGGGSVLFHMLSKHTNISRAIINDINPVLMNAYQTIKNDPISMIQTLTNLKGEYIRLSLESERETFYYRIRETYNKMRIDDDQKIAFFIFLNHTCFNGLYRENKSGMFNVPHGKYKDPGIFDVNNINMLHEVLQKVEICCGDFEDVFTRPLSQHTFIYFDPPYRPISKQMSMFTQYDKSGFTDIDQLRLKEICDICTNQGNKLMLSNSDSYDDDASYFENLYNNNYNIERIKVTRMINPYNAKDRKPNEVIITNYQTQKSILDTI